MATVAHWPSSLTGFHLGGSAAPQELQDLGLAEGVFFSPLRVEGPSVEDAPKMGAPSGEMLALLAGKVAWPWHWQGDSWTTELVWFQD